MKKNYQPNYDSNEKVLCLKRTKGMVGFSKAAAMTTIMLLLTVTGLKAQVSGAWDSFTGNGTPGNNNYGNGVIRLISDVNTGCAAGAVHETSSPYDPNGGTTFTKCYQVFFGCPGNDNINSDANGDGMAFSFWKTSATYNINNGLACGGGLGYMGSASDGKMITIEFDTYSSAFDGTYGGGTSGINDEISVHVNGDAGTSGLATGGTINAGNLEDGLEHTICVTYVPGTHILSVTIDGTPKLSYDLGATYNLQTYFGAGSLNWTWSSGKFGATNPTTVNDGNGTLITSQLGGVPLCPAAVDITSPSDGSVIDPCAGPITITATATPPAGATVTSVDFLVDGAVISTDASFPYAANWTPTTGDHVLTAVAHYSNSTNSTSPNSNITVGAIALTGTAPVIDGSVEALWSSYSAFTLTKNNGATGADLSANYKIMYDATNLYVLVNVTDDVKIRDGSGATWEDDGVELFIDIGNNKSGTYGSNDYQYSFNWNSATIIENKWSATAGVTMGQTNTGTGYIMEMKLPWSTLGGTPTPGTNLGFEVKLNDDDNNGTRDNELGWKDGSFGAWNNPALFGTLPFSGCNPLPVSLLSFTGEKSNGTTVLNWITTSEINNKQFIVERSTNGSDWEAIGEVAGAGNSTSINTYSFTDNTDLDGKVYYRLRQVDFDGAAAYSNVVTVNSGGTQSLTISPNPFDGAFTVNCDIAGSLTIEIYDVVGQLLYSVMKENNDGTVSIQPELPAGAYVVVVRTDSFVKQQKVIKR